MTYRLATIHEFGVGVSIFDENSSTKRFSDNF